MLAKRHIPKFDFINDKVLYNTDHPPIALDIVFEHDSSRDSDEYFPIRFVNHRK